MRQRRLLGALVMLALLAAAPVSLLIFFAELGVRPDIMTAMRNPFFDLKFAITLALAISAIAVVGAILVSGEENASTFQLALGLIAVLAASLNIVSGYLITDRMLKMFRKREPEQK